MQTATKQQAQQILSSNPFNVSVLALSSATVLLIGLLIFSVWDNQEGKTTTKEASPVAQKAFILNQDTQTCLAAGGGATCGTESYHYQLNQKRMKEAGIREIQRQEKQSSSNSWDSAIAKCDSANIYWLNGEYYGCGLGY